MIFENEIHLLEETNFLLENGRLIRTFLVLLENQLLILENSTLKKAYTQLNMYAPLKTT